MSSSQYYKYQIYCDTSGTWETTDWTQTEPTTCPIDVSHSVILESVQEDEIRDIHHDTIVPTICCTNSTTYQNIAVFTHGGTDEERLMKVIVVARCDSGITYDLRLQGFLTSVLMKEITGLTNTSTENITFPGVDIEPPQKCIICVQARRVGGTIDDNVHIDSIRAEFITA